MNRIMKSAGLGLTIGLALALGGCAGVLQQVTGATVSQKLAGGAIGLYNVAETAAIKYENLPLCTGSQTTLANACRNKGPTATLNGIMNVGDSAVDQLQAALTAASAAGSAVGVAAAAYNAVVGYTGSLKASTP